MSEFTVVVLRIAFFLMLWLFVFAVAGVLRKDIFGPKKSRRDKRAMARNQQVPAAGPAPAPQSAYTPAPSPAPTPEPRAHTLVVTSGPRTGTTIALGDSPITIGRSSANTLPLGDDYASGRHAQIAPRGTGWVLEDLGSTNGTFIGERRIQGSEHLHIGTSFTVGHSTLELRS